MADTNNIIPNGLRADVMRNKMENKDALKEDGYIYIGTGNKIKIEADGNTYEIPVTTGMHISKAITKYGANALNPISISSKDDLVNTKDGTLTELAKKSFVYTVSNSVKLQDADAANNKEEVIIPALSKGMVLSDTANLLVTYGTFEDGEISGSFFYHHDWEKWIIVKANIANILDSETMKTTNDGLIPKTTDSVNLGSKDNSFNTIYTKYYNGNGVNFRPTQFKEGTTNVDIGYGYDAAGAADPAATTPKAHIDAHIFYDGLNQGELSWIKAKGIIPHNNNEINFNVEGAGTNDLIFGRGGSTQAIGNYIFYNGKGTDTYSDITCKGLYLQTGIDVGTNIEAKGYIQASYFNATSDKRLKENIIPFTPEKSILDLPVYTFNFKSDKNKKKHIGCLAQDLQEICPDLVNEDSQGYLSIEESKITYLLLEEVKELKKQVEELKGKINELEGK